MITDAMIQARIQSQLSDSFVILDGADGTRYVAFSGILLDYPTFCVMLIWALNGGRMYSAILEGRDGWLKKLQELNPDSQRLASMTDTVASNWIFKRLVKMLADVRKCDVESVFLDQMADLRPIY